MVKEVEKAIKFTNKNSSPGHDGLTPMHLSCSHPVIHVILSLLFSTFISHSLFPDDLLKVFISPIVKDKNGDMSSKK